ncbi:MAG: DegT/DnrJ/EryC1/StrS family aminotransferase [Thermoplasmata archaeon]
MIPIAKPILGDEEKKAIASVLESGMLAQGPKVKEFEEKFSKYIGTKYAIATNNGTTALHLGLLAAGVKQGDEVITTPFSFIATATTIIFCGAKPVFVDIDPGTFNIDASKIENAITPKTKAIMPVHLYGLPAEMDRIMEIAKKHDLAIIEDACQAHGAEFNGKRVGAFGDCGCFSFYPTKNMTTGEGGMITTNNEKIAEKTRLLREHGQKARYEHVMVGYNYRLTDIHAAVGIEQLKKLEGFNKKRIENAKILSKGVQERVEVPYVPPNTRHVYHQYTIKVKNRDELKEKLAKDGVSTGIYYPKLIYQYPPMNKYAMKTKVAEGMVNEVISLPVHPSLSRADLDKIIESVVMHSK